MNEVDQKAEKKRGTAEAGLVYFGSILTGVIGIYGACYVLSSKDYSGGGMYLLASAFAFGLLANALFRH
ncbi:hypothetical protein [Gimesia fumaroli]|uniref:Uncharacterized protein n=1 Tax=Gimesia fumaroli TaxID=2527976 RepID=A0A518IIF0_9PLAN|nr:hypothetical protein [Gimesia fumaroli]QDV52865.1 hypothetical protein Enr17x_49350 [Gimesia fumaroli]